MKYLKLLFYMALPAVCMNAAAVRTLPNLTQVTFWELTSGATQYNFAPGSAAMTTRLAGNLSASNNDFQGLTTESYDVFYSNADGTFNLDGEFITIEGTYTGSSSSGLNIAEVGLLINGQFQYASSVASFVTGSVAYVAGSEALIVDGNLSTGTAMGRSAANERMRVTVGFDAPGGAQTPEPSTLGMAGIGVVALILGRKRLKK